jgi:hypothetical protein
MDETIQTAMHLVKLVCLEHNQYCLERKDRPSVRLRDIINIKELHLLVTKHKIDIFYASAFYREIFKLQFLDNSIG